MLISAEHMYQFKEYMTVYKCYVLSCISLIQITGTTEKWLQVANGQHKHDYSNNKVV